MLTFVNAKINLGLNIVGKRSDGYHLLETMFYPVGRFNGTPQCPYPFCDLLEITSKNDKDPEDFLSSGLNFIFEGNSIDCAPEKNLVVRAALKYLDHQPGMIEKTGPLTIRLKKNIPDGAGMGGGSADATFTLTTLNKIAEKHGLKPLDDKDLEETALALGADCPVFVKNRPAYAEGIGEKLRPEGEILKGMWLGIVKPNLHISTAEAFAGVEPHRPEESLRDILRLPIREWRGRLKNDFEESLFPKYPELKRLKDELYRNGAEFALMTGSGAALYGIFNTREDVVRAMANISAPYAGITLL